MPSSTKYDSSTLGSLYAAAAKAAFRRALTASFATVRAFIKSEILQYTLVRKHSNTLSSFSASESGDRRREEVLCAGGCGGCGSTCGKEELIDEIDDKGDVEQSDSILAQYKALMGNYLNEVLESDDE